MRSAMVVLLGYVITYTGYLRGYFAPCGAVLYSRNRSATLWGSMGQHAGHGVLIYRLLVHQ
jgi:hypothetical protein